MSILIDPGHHLSTTYVPWDRRRRRRPLASSNSSPASLNTDASCSSLRMPEVADVCDSEGSAVSAVAVPELFDIFSELGDDHVKEIDQENAVGVSERVPQVTLDSLFAKFENIKHRRDAVSLATDEDELLIEVPVEVKSALPLFNARVLRSSGDGSHAFPGRVVDVQFGSISREMLYRLRYDDADMEDLDEATLRRCCLIQPPLI